MSDSPYKKKIINFPWIYSCYAICILSILAFYLPGTDEYIQIQAAYNLLNGYGLTHVSYPSTCSEYCTGVGQYQYLSAYPPGLSLFLTIFLTVLTPTVSAAMLKLLAILIAVIIWRKIILKPIAEIVDIEQVTLFLSVFFLLVAFQSTSDIFLVAYVPFLYRFYRSIKNSSFTWRITVEFGFVTALALLLKYQAVFFALPFYVGAFIYFIFGRNRGSIVKLCCGALFPAITTGTYVWHSYLNTNELSTQMIILGPKIDNINFSLSYLFDFLKSIFFESFLFTKYIIKIFDKFNLARAFEFGFFVLFSSTVLISITRCILSAESKIKELINFNLLIIAVNAICLLFLTMIIVPEDIDFNPFTYYRYYTSSVPIFLICFWIVIFKRVVLLQRALTIGLATIAIMLVAVKTLEAKEASDINDVLESKLVSLQARHTTDTFLVFAPHTVWRSAISKEQIYRYSLSELGFISVEPPVGTQLLIFSTKDSDLSAKNIPYLSKDRYAEFKKLELDGGYDLFVEKNK